MILLNYAVFLGLWQIFVVPFCLAVCRAREFVSHPEHRVLPETSWNLFTQNMRRQLRIWKIVWIICLAAFAILGFFLAHRDGLPVALALFLGTLAPAMFMILWFWAAAGCMVLAGPIERPWAMILLANVFSIIATVALVLIIQAGLPALGVPKAYVEYRTSNQNQIISIGMFYVLLIAAAGLYWSVRRAKGKGDAWFRFPQ